MYQVTATGASPQSSRSSAPSALSLDSHLHVPHDHLLGSLFPDSRDFCCAACCEFSWCEPVTTFTNTGIHPGFFGLDNSHPILGTLACRWHCSFFQRFWEVPSLAVFFTGTWVPSLAVFFTGAWVPSLAVFFTGTWVPIPGGFFSSRPFGTCFIKPSARSCANCSVLWCFRGIHRVHLSTPVPPVFFGIDSSLPCQLVGPLFRFLFTCLLSCLSRADSWFRLARDFNFRLHLVARFAIFHFVLLLHVSSLCCTFVCSGSKENNCQSLIFVSLHHLHFWLWFCHFRLFLQRHLRVVYSNVACNRSLQHHCVVLCQGVVTGLVPSRGSLPQRGQLFLRTGFSVVSLSFFVPYRRLLRCFGFSNTTT